MQILFTLLVLFSVPAAIGNEAISYQYGVGGFTSYKDVRLFAAADDYVYDINLEVRNNSDHTLLGFYDLSVPAGEYEVSLSIISIETVSNGSAMIYELVDSTEWQEPPASQYATAGNQQPTWSHLNYNNIAWTVPGGVGGPELELRATIPSIGSGRKIATFIQEYDAEVTRMDFLLASSGYFKLGNHEQHLTSVLPILTFTPVEEETRLLGGLDWSAFFRGWFLLR